MAGNNSAAPSSDALVLFDVTGDLARKNIFPSLYAMAKRGVLNVPMVGLDTSRLRETE
jgi:glucose-6-phosphate 1-dehydrogenase